MGSAAVRSLLTAHYPSPTQLWVPVGACSSLRARQVYHLLDRRCPQTICMLTTCVTAALRLPAPQIWMCIGKDLKPFDCEPPKADRAACSQLTIPPLPHSGGGSGSSSSATAQRGAVHASEMEWAEPRVQQEQQEEEQAVAWASTASATGGVEAVADLANLEDDREEDGEEEHEDEHDNDSDDGDDDDDKEEEEEEEDEDDVQDSVWDGVNQQADSAVPAAAYHTSDSASFDPSSASAGAVRPQDSIFEALSATWAATRAALEARLLGLMRAAGHDLPLTAEEARAQAAAAAAFQQHAAAAAAAFGRAGAAQQREAGESRRSDGASDPMDSVYSLLLATAMTRDGAVQRGAADVEAAAGTADATAADMNADPELLGLLGQADAEAEALGVAALARSLDLASGGALTRAVRADAAGGRSSSGTTAGMSAASGGVQEAGQAQQPEQAEGKEGQQQEGEGIFAYVMRMVTVVAAHGSGGMPGRGCAHKGKGKGAMAGSRVGDISSRQFMWQSRIREQGDVMRDEAEAQAEAGRAQVQQRAVPGHGGGGAAAASASGARHEHPLPVRHASVSDGDDEVRWDVLVVQQGQQQSEQGAGLDVGDAAVLAVQQQPFSVAPLLLVACQVAGGAAVLCAAVVLAVAAWGRGRGGAGGEGMEEPLLAGERGEQQQEGEERGAKEAVVSVH